MGKYRLVLAGAFALAACGGGGDARPDGGAALFTPVTLSGNWHSSCAIREDGALYCWGDLLDGPAATPARVGDATTTWRDVAVGSAHACAIRSDGALYCWGHNCAGQLGDGTRADRELPVRVGEGTRWRRVAVGGGHSCAIDEDAAMWCWGGADYGQSSCLTTPPAPPSQVPGRWREVSSHYYATHALASDGTLWRWKDGSLDVPTPGFDAFVALGHARWRAIASGVFGVCGVREDGRLACVADDADEETTIGDDDDWGDAVAASYHACALRQDGSLWCLGRNDYGQLGGGVKTEADSATLVRVGDASDWIAVSAGGVSSCGRRRDGSVWCWGGNASGELGLGELPYHPLPSRVGDALGWSSPTSGYQFSCAITAGSALACWGSGARGQLGSEARKDELAPTLVPGLWRQVAASAWAACALDRDASLWCWGGLAADGHLRRRITSGAEAWASLGLGDSASCVVDAAGQASWWPSGYRADRVPTPVPGVFTWRSLASAFDHTCGVLTDGTLRCWGANGQGQLGSGAGTGDSAEPVEVAGGGQWLAVATGEGGNPDAGYSCAVRADHRLFCWGGGSWGHLGDGASGGVVPAPRQVGSDADWATVSLGAARACALKTSGELWCWGRNDDGGLGIGVADGLVHRPERIGAERSWAEVSVSGHTCATATDGSLWCWGWGEGGELGDGTAWRLAPTEVTLGE